MYEKVYEENCRLVSAIARRYARVCEVDHAVSMEDLLQTGFIGLANAADTFDPAGGKSWSAWATWKVERELGRFLGLRDGYLSRPHIGAVELDRPLPTDEGDGEALVDQLADDSLPEPDAALLNDELRQALRDAMERLENEDQRRVATLCKLEGRSYREAADQLGISVERTRRLWQRAADRLARDRPLRSLAGLDERTRFHAHKGVEAFNRDWTSVTEAAALWRIEQQNLEADRAASATSFAGSGPGVRGSL